MPKRLLTTLILSSLLLLIAVVSAIHWHAAPTDPLARHIALVALLGATFLLWFHHEIPRGITALTLLVFTQLLGLNGEVPLFAGFSQDSFFFLLAVLFVGTALSTTGLAVRLCQRLLRRRKTISSFDFLWRVPLFLFLFSVVVSSATARVGLLKPVSDGILERGDAPGLSKYLTVYVAHTSTLTSRAFLSGGPGIIVAADLMSRAGHPLNWFQWVIWMGAPVLLITALSTVFHWLWLRPESYQVEHTVAERFTYQDGLMLLIVGSMITLWMFGAWFNVSTTNTALLGMAAVALVLRDSNFILRQIDWDIVLFSGGTLSFAYIILESGTAGWVGNLLFGPIFQMANTPWIVLLVLTALMLLRFPLSNGVSYSAVVFPIILSLGPIGPLDALHVSFTALIAGALAFLPVQSMPSLMSYDSRRYSVADTVVSGSLMFIASFLVIQFFALHYWSWLQG